MTYKVQIDDTVRNATSAETVLIDTQRTDAASAAAAIAQIAAVKASASAKLAALGLTADEVAALIGG
jgi:hypothetical protein